MKITIGYVDPLEARSVSIDLDTLIATRLLIQANSGAGKSYLLRVLMEQLFGHIQVIAIDPEGEFATLREKYGFVLVGKGGETPADPRSAAIVAEKLLELKASAICDLYEMKPLDRHRWVQTFLDALVNIRKELWHPVVVIVDEAHLFCPEKGAGESVASDAMIDLATRGRKRGFCAVWATQRLSKLRKDASAEMLNRLIGGTFEDLDTKRALDLLSVPSEEKRDFAAKLKLLQPGWFFAFGRAIAKERVLFKVRQAETSHPKSGSAKHAAEPPPAPEKVRELLPKLADLPKEAAERAQTVDDLKRRIADLTRELSTARKAQPAPGVDQEVIRQLVVESVSKSLKMRDDEWSNAMQGFRLRVRDRAKSAITEALVAAIDDCEFKYPAAAKVSAEVEVKRASSPGAAGTTRKEAEVTRNRGAVPHTAPRQIAANDGNITEPQRRILAALATFEAIGRYGVSKKWIAALAGASHTSSSYGNNLGALRTAGLIDYPQPGAVSLTVAGRSHTPAVEVPTSTAEMLDRCKQVLTGPQAAILEELHHAYPEPLNKNELAELVSASSTSSSYGNNLGALRSAGMIDYPAPGKVKAADWLFLE